MRASKSDNTVSSMEIMDSSNGYTPLINDNIANVLSGVRRRPVRVAGVCVAVLCFLLLAAIIGQAVHHRDVESNQEQSYKMLTSAQEKLQQSLSDADLEKKQLAAGQTRLQQEYDYISSQKNYLQTNNEILSKERDTLKASQSQQQANTAALTKERDQLKASQSQLQSSNTELNKARDFLQKSYDALALKMAGIQKISAALEVKKDELEDHNNQLKHNMEQVQSNFTMLLNMIMDLKFGQDISAQEKEKLRSSHDIVLEQRDQLNTSLQVLESTTKQLQEGYTAVMTERDDLLAMKANQSAALDSLLTQNQNLAAERDLLLTKAKNSTDETGCPSGWLTYQQVCFSCSTTGNSWQDSGTQCLQQGNEMEVWIDTTVDGREWMWVDETQMMASF